MLQLVLVAWNSVTAIYIMVPDKHSGAGHSSVVFSDTTSYKR